jgi:hypothetical protein
MRFRGIMGKMSDANSPTDRRSPLLRFVLIAITLSCSLVAGSYFQARSHADRLIAKVQTRDSFQPSGARLSLFHNFSGRRGPCWEFDYDPDNFSVVDLTLEVSFFGEVRASNPQGALSELRSLPLPSPKPTTHYGNQTSQ